MGRRCRVLIKPDGCLICAVDKDRTVISVTLAYLDKPELIVPGKTHGIKSDAPNWWRVLVERQERDLRSDQILYGFCFAPIECK